MKVMIGNDTYPPDVNGAAYFTKRLAEGLADRGHEVHVLCPSRNLRNGLMTRDGVVEYRMRSLPVPLHAGFRFSPPPFLRRHVLEEVRRTRPDVVHAQGHFFIGRALIRAAKQLGVPVVACVVLEGIRHRKYRPPIDRVRMWRFAALSFSI